MICPKCGSNNVRTDVITETNSKVKGFAWIKACFGWLVFGVYGILCGLCGMGKEKRHAKSRTIHICQNCGKTF